MNRKVELNQKQASQDQQKQKQQNSESTVPLIGVKSG